MIVLKSLMETKCFNSNLVNPELSALSPKMLELTTFRAGKLPGTMNNKKWKRWYDVKRMKYLQLWRQRRCRLWIDARTMFLRLRFSEWLRSNSWSSQQPTDWLNRVSSQKWLNRSPKSISMSASRHRPSSTVRATEQYRCQSPKIGEQR